MGFVVDVGFGLLSGNSVDAAVVKASIMFGLKKIFGGAAGVIYETYYAVEQAADQWAEWQKEKEEGFIIKFNGAYQVFQGTEVNDETKDQLIKQMTDQGVEHSRDLKSKEEIAAERRRDLMDDVSSRFWSPAYF